MSETLGERKKPATYWDWWWSWVPSPLTKRWCARYGHPESGRLEFWVCTGEEHEPPDVVLQLCGFCYTVIGWVERG